MTGLAILTVVLIGGGAWAAARTGGANSPRDLRSAVVESESVVRIEGTGCGETISGTGFVVDAGLVATNAHVVAGIDRIFVDAESGPPRSARIVAFDEIADLALLDVEVDAPIATLSSSVARSGQKVATVGYGGDDDQRRRDGNVDHRSRARKASIFNEGRHEKTLVFLDIRSAAGDSGSPVFDADGEVIAVIFAATDRGRMSAAVDATEVADLMESRSLASSYERCTTGSRVFIQDFGD